MSYCKMIKKPTRLPDEEEIAELNAYLPRLYAPGFIPLKNRAGGRDDKSGVSQASYPVYDALVNEFIQAASRECWCDHNYEPPEAGKMLRDEAFIKTGDLQDIKTLLTFCVRGERFCYGHWARMIENGNIRRLLERLVEISSRAARS